MSIIQITTRDTQLEKQRLGLDLAVLEDDSGTFKVSLGSVIECAGALYEVTSTAETPSGTQQPGEYLFFDPSGPSFVWSSTRGTWDGTKNGWYDGSSRRQCHYLLSSATGETPDERWNLLINGPPGTIEHITINIGDWNMVSTTTISVNHELPDFTKLRGLEVIIVNDTEDQIQPLNCGGNNYADGDMQGWIRQGGTSTLFGFGRLTGGRFDNTAFDSTSFNRGWMRVAFEVQ